MDSRKVLLGAALATVLFLIYNAYLDFANKRNINQNSVSNSILTTTQNTNQNSPVSDAPNAITTDNNSNDIPNISENSAQQNFNQINNNLIEVNTNEYQIFISLNGGSIIQLGLKQYPVSVEKPNEPFLLMKNESFDKFILNSGIISPNGDLPNHTSTFQSAKTNYVMETNELVVPLIWENEKVKITKKYTFNRESYLIKLSYDIENKSDDTLSVIDYGQFNRLYVSTNSNFLMMPSYVGGAVYANEKYKKLDFDTIKESNLNEESLKGWVAMTQHYFFSALIPNKGKNINYYSKALADSSVNLGYKSTEFTQIPANSKLEDVGIINIYAGSKESRILKTLAPSSDTDTDYLAEKLYLTADYGWLAFVARPLFSYMQWIFSWVNSWPLTIVLLVLTIKLIFYKLSEKSYRSMAKMRKLTPRLTSIKERCGDDKAAFQREMMSLYKNEKVNPMSGCFPILIQIPVFIALYWVLLESVEMRQVPFFWIKDLSLADPYYILPIIMAATMFIQFKLNPKPADETQAKVMMFMPLVFSILFVFFPAALVFYWVVNNAFSIIQQYIITKRIEKES